VGTDPGTQAVAGLNSEGAQTKWRAADRQWCLQIEETGGSEASRYRAWGGSGVNAISCSTEHTMPEPVECRMNGRVVNKKVAAVGHNRKDSAED